MARSRRGRRRGAAAGGALGGAALALLLALGLRAALVPDEPAAPAAGGPAPVASFR